MRSGVLVLLLVAGCGYTWRPALVVSVDAMHASRTLLEAGRSAERWDVRAEATLVLAPRPVRPLLVRDPGPRRPERPRPPCRSAWLCAWERSARAHALAGIVPALSEARR